MNFLARMGRALTKAIFNGYGGASGLGWLGFKGVDYEQHIGDAVEVEHSAVVPQVRAARGHRGVDPGANLR